MAQDTSTQVFIQHPTTLNQSEIIIGANAKLKLKDAEMLALRSLPVALSDESYVAMNRSYQFLKSCIDQRLPIYGINTQFGDQVSYLDPYLKNKEIPEADYYRSIQERQLNLIRSHTCSAGEYVRSDIIKVAIMLRAHCLSQGFSGVSTQAIDAMLAFLNAGITPLVKCYGSIGASGDLIPLASIAAGIIGEQVDVLYQGETMKAPQALERAGLSKLIPQLRDGLAMINGTSFMTAISSLSLYKLVRLTKQMLSAIAMSLESMLVITSGYHPLVHQLKGQSGEKVINDFLLDFWQGSQLVTDLDELRHATVSETHSQRSVQDYYSLRAVAQGFGGFHENLIRGVQWVENEMNSVNDNPIIDAEEKKIHHSANFMGYYITETCDILKNDIAQASTWLHALLANLVHPRKNHDLPANLVNNPGKNNGFRPIQLLTAALAVENRKLAQCHQSYMLPTEGDNQDVNSLGTHAAFDFQKSVDNLERLTAIMLLASTQALEIRGIEKASPKAQTIFHTIRKYSSTLGECRPMSEEINMIVEILQEGKI